MACSRLQRPDRPPQSSGGPCFRPPGRQDKRARLGCQAVFDDDLVVHRRGVEPLLPDTELMHVTVFPAHDRLQDIMLLTARTTGRTLDHFAPLCRRAMRRAVRRMARSL
jgi:hypothetical protein